ncbi:MAG TPA: serine/threonine-protein kinase, partial [Vicinamibacterales bacterium]|nr:serine/threonine-protein kinase [Vicinamibacterales bacterium]
MGATDRWSRIEEICHAALDRDVADRQAFIAAACGDDAALRHEVEALLAHAHTAEQFLAEPALMSVGLTREVVSMVGQRISQYTIVEKLGAGGMGVVYRAEDTKLRRAVALKFLPPELTRDDDAKRRFMFEAQAASALEHTNICTIYDIAETADGQLFLAMAYYAGETLRHTIDRGPLTLADTLDYGIQIAEGLVKAHAAGIVHRDIKPANVLVTKDGVVKIVDFGIAKLLGQSGATRAVATRTGATRGTVGYMSPEQLAGRPIDARSDIWSLGVVLYEMAAGRRPFDSDNPESVAWASAHATPQPLTAVRRDVPPELQRVVACALATDPKDRYQTTAELLAQLQQVKAALNRPPTAL